MSAQTSRTQESNDERAIRELVDKWLAASRTGDLATVLGLMTEDVIFMVPGREPFGKREFAESDKQMKDVKLEFNSDVQEIKVLGDWAWMRHHLEVTFTAPNSPPTRHSGYILSILRRNPDGAWLLARDANLLAEQPKT